jgi:parallel beta-helix repeat protein
MSEYRRQFRGRNLSVLALVLGCAAALPLASAVAVADTDRSEGSTYFVSPGGSDGNSCGFTAPCATIGRAVSMAGSGDTVVVRGGTYHEQVTLTVGLTLRGIGRPTIDATGLGNGVLVTGAGAAGARVMGFRVQNATYEGILLFQTQDVTVERNTVTSNDQGIFLPPEQQVGECAANGPIPGDCGEGIHLWAVTRSKVEHNRVANNAGGILLTDETGPTAFNLIADNTVVDNAYDCGITIAGHNPGAAPGGVPAPSVAGIYSNLVVHNRADRNGVLGEGAGILLAGAGPGTGVYGNQVLENEASGNGLAGITLHCHAPGQDLNGNVIRGNRLSNDNLDGDFDFSPFTDSQTTGILLASATALTGTVVEDNEISNVYYGIWTLNLPTISATANDIDSNVTVPVFQQ